MSKTYTIDRVSPEVKEWEGKFGPMVTYRVMFEGLQEAVEMNKKPNSPKPNKGDEVTGTIEDGPFAKKFKAESTFNKSANESKPAYKDNSDGMRQGMCFNNAASYVEANNQKLDPQPWAKLVYLYANELYKLGDLGKEPTGYEKAKAVRENVLKTVTSDSKDEDDEIEMDMGNEEIDLSQIPF